MLEEIDRTLLSNSSYAKHETARSSMYKKAFLLNYVYHSRYLFFAKCRVSCKEAFPLNDMYHVRHSILFAEMAFCIMQGCCFLFSE